MLKSMTGFGKYSYEGGERQIMIELKSVNSKNLDISFKLPSLFKEKELELRSYLSQKLQRGKIEMYVFYESYTEESAARINPEIINNYYKQIQEIAESKNIPQLSDPFATIIRLPDAVSNQKESLDEELWNEVKAYISHAVNDLQSYRRQEGAAMEKDIRSSLQVIEEHMSFIQGNEKERIEKIKERIDEDFNKYLRSKSQNIDELRYEQEIIYYLEKLDINEELVRLRNHCDYFYEVIDSEPPNGKKLQFIAQELGREINTIGSKANDSNIQRSVVQMKEALEQIKEQLMNIL